MTVSNRGGFQSTGIPSHRGLRYLYESCCDAIDGGSQANAMREFELLGSNDDSPNPLLLDRLRACTAVIDALGYKVKLCL